MIADLSLDLFLDALLDVTQELIPARGAARPAGLAGSSPSRTR